MAKWIAKALVSLALLAVAAVALIAGWAEAVASSNPELALRINPGPARALLSLAEKTRLTGGGSTDEVARLGARLMRRSPLSDAPLVYAGQNFIAKGDKTAAREAFTLVLRRQPRNVPALSWLAADALGQHRLELAADYLVRLSGLNGKDGLLYSEVLAFIATDAQGVQVLESQLAKGSALAEMALARLNATSGDIPMLLRLNAHSSTGKVRLVERLLAERGPLQAFLAWLALSPESETQSFSWPFDPAFVGSAAPPPFNWKVFDGAELLKQGGLYVRYSGRAAPVFAEQLMVLGPGRYAFRVEMDGDIAETGGRFDWTIECDPKRERLGSVSIGKLGSTLSSHQFSFEVPREGCAAQHLLLRGRPSEFPTGARATVRRVAIQSGSVVE